MSLAAVVVNLAKQPETSPLSRLLSVVVGRLVRGGSIRDGLRGWQTDWTWSRSAHQLSEDTTGKREETHKFVYDVMDVFSKGYVGGEEESESRTLVKNMHDNKLG